ncbi:major facilitator superfamily domain-containing protein [Fomitopsis serialis]|uniref:major facilitator superfamily domain-containing protein n=1 Tax=Fomitopsis serialis TaxID=139415 RepID=UPI002007F70F|nr:major facilitator superfamily domain-containing protein [Neoantrodia serialis]KAH9925769.1 major facilitator superfamily domain-containing protein [Neoantrodia serialis]
MDGLQVVNSKVSLQPAAVCRHPLLVSASHIRLFVLYFFGTGLIASVCDRRYSPNRISVLNSASRRWSHVLNQEKRDLARTPVWLPRSAYVRLMTSPSAGRRDSEKAPKSHDDSQSLAQQPAALSASAAPDGGARAWLQVLGGFFILFNSWGIFNTYGAFQTYYEQELFPSSSASAISWIGSIQGFLLLLVGSLTGPIFDMGYTRVLMIVGSFLMVFSLMMTSLSTQYYEVRACCKAERCNNLRMCPLPQAFLALGVTFGLGSGCVFVPGVAIVSTYFNKRRGLAVGITTSGSSIGSVVYLSVFHQLQPRIGFPWTVRVMGFIVLATSAVSIAVMQRRIAPSGRRRLFDAKAFAELPYTLFCIGNAISFMGTYIPFFEAPAFAAARTSASPTLAFYFLAILSAASTLGRLLPNFLADKTGPLTMLAGCATATGILALSWLAVHTVGGFVVFCVLYGLFSGSLVSLPPAAVASLTDDHSRLGARLGMAFALAGFGLLIGNPVAGVLVDLRTGEFWKGIVFNGVAVLAAGTLLLAARVAKAGWSPKAKV